MWLFICKAWLDWWALYQTFQKIKGVRTMKHIPVFRANGCICLHSAYTAELTLKDVRCPIHGIGGLKSKNEF